MGRRTRRRRPVRSCRRSHAYTGQLIASARTEADGWRQVHPGELGALTAAEARAQLREENGLPAETPAEAAAAEDLLATAAGSAEEATAARTVLGPSITRTEALVLGQLREPSAP